MSLLHSIDSPVKVGMLAGSLVTAVAGMAVLAGVKPEPAK